MAADLESHSPLYLNLGGGKHRLPRHVNVDLYGKPDLVWDLNITPYPWADNSVDGIEMWHTLEHLENWWDAFTECARILRPGGRLHIRVPDESNPTALTYRDHLHVFNPRSFHGIAGSRPGANSWAEEERESIPLRLESYYQVPFEQYQWMARWCPWLLRFCADHLRGFIWEQRFEFVKIGG
jgi:SAM-dependent methyltransferase